MPHNRSVDSDTLRQGAAHLHVERPLSFAVTGGSWPLSDRDVQGSQCDPLWSVVISRVRGRSLVNIHAKS